jgi:hypothetical protein
MLKESTTEEQEDVREVLISSMKEVEAKEDPKVEDPKGEDPKVEDPKVEDPKVEDPKVEDPKVEEPTLLKEDKAPQSWSPAAREKWATIPEDLRKEIIRREEAAAIGVRQINERFTPAAKFTEALDPYIKEAQNGGIDPVGYISSVMQTEKALRTADVKGKFEILMRLADQYGVPLRDVINQSVGQEVIKPQQPAIPQEVARELEENRRWRAEQETGAARRELESFSANNEFFNDVRMMMADLIQSGVARGLQDAYDQACWTHPSVRQVLLDRKLNEGKQQDLTSRQTSAREVNIPSQGALPVNTKKSDDESLEETIRAAFGTASARI